MTAMLIGDTVIGRDRFLCDVGVLGHDRPGSRRTSGRAATNSLHEKPRRAGTSQDHPHCRGVNQDAHVESQAELLV